MPTRRFANELFATKTTMIGGTLVCLEIHFKKSANWEVRRGIFAKCQSHIVYGEIHSNAYRRRSVGEWAIGRTRVDGTDDSCSLKGSFTGPARSADMGFSGVKKRVSVSGHADLPRTGLRGRRTTIYRQTIIGLDDLCGFLFCLEAHSVFRIRVQYPVTAVWRRVTSCR